MNFPYTQVRIARHTQQLTKIVEFYAIGLGLPQIGSFSDHDGYDGVMFGLPGREYHLEFTQHVDTETRYTAPDKDNLLVFYMQDRDERDTIMGRLSRIGYPAVEPENPYWKERGITIEDPDKWRIVLMLDRF